MTLIDLFRRFSQLSDQRNLPASVRSVYFALLYAWNEQRRPEVFIVEKSGLKRLSGLPQRTFTESLTYLSRAGFIKMLPIRDKFRLRITLATSMLSDSRESATTAAALNARTTRETPEVGEESPPQQGDSSYQLNEGQNDDATIYDGTNRTLSPNRRTEHDDAQEWLRTHGF